MGKKTKIAAGALGGVGLIAGTGLATTGLGALGGGLAGKHIHEEQIMRRLLKLSEKKRDEKITRIFGNQMDNNKEIKFRKKLGKFALQEAKHMKQGSVKRGLIRAGKLGVGVGALAGGLSAGALVGVPLLAAGTGIVGYQGVKGAYYGGRKIRKSYNKRYGKHASPSRRKRRRKRSIKRKRRSRRRPSRRRRRRSKK